VYTYFSGRKFDRSTYRKLLEIRMYEIGKERKSGMEEVGGNEC
jgi:hypothetical protein